MFRRSLVVLILLTFAPFATPCLAREAASSTAQVYDNWRADLLELAQWCSDNGLIVEARDTLNQAIDAGDAQRAPAALAALNDSKSKAPAAAVLGEYITRDYAVRQHASADYVALAQGAEKDRAEHCYQQALTFDPHCAQARAFLKQKGIDGVGWYSEEEYAALTARAITLQTAKEPPGKGPFVLTTDHFSIVADMSFKAAKDAGAHAEMVYRAFKDAFGSVIPEPSRKLGLRLFADKEAYRKALVEEAMQSPEAADLAGWYVYHLGMVYACAACAQRTGGILRTLSHECVHQLAAVGMYGHPSVSNRYLRLVMSPSPCAFVVEGMAVYFEALAKKGDGHSIPGLDKYRKFLVSEKAEQAKLDALPDFVELDRAAWSNAAPIQVGRRYAMAGELVRFCLTSKIATRQTAMLTAIQSYYHGGVGSSARSPTSDNSKPATGTQGADGQAGGAPGKEDPKAKVAEGPKASKGTAFFALLGDDATGFKEDWAKHLEEMKKK